MRRVGDPSPVAAAIAFLAVNAVAFITGQTLFVDGGASLGTFSKKHSETSKSYIRYLWQNFSNMESSTYLYDRPRQPGSEKKQAPEL